MVFGMERVVNKVREGAKEMRGILGASAPMVVILYRSNVSLS